MQQAKRLVLVSLLSMTLTACETTQIIGTRGPNNPLCIAMKPVTFSAMNDTPETIMQIRENNAAWDAVCKDHPILAPWAK